jgi:hypothetical protein
LASRNAVEHHPQAKSALYRIILNCMMALSKAQSEEPFALS